MKVAGQVLMIIGGGLFLWGIYQFFSNQPSQVSEPKDISEGIQALTDLYSNVFEKREKQSQAKEIGGVGAVMLLIGVITNSVARRQGNSSTIPTNVETKSRFCRKCGSKLDSSSTFCGECGAKAE